MFSVVTGAARRSARVLLVTLFLLFAGQSLPGLSAAAHALHIPTLRVGCDEYLPPYEYLNEYGEATGYNIEVIRFIAQAMGYRIEVKAGPWEKMRTALLNGEVDVLSGMFYSEERARSFDFSAPHLIVSHAIFTRKGSGIATLEDLKGKEIIVQYGDIMHDTLKSTGLGSHIITVEDQTDALTLLASGRGDAALISRMLGLFARDRFGLENLTVASSSMFPMEYCFAVGKGNQALLSQINTGLATIKTNGRLKEIRDRWFSEYDSYASGSHLKVVGWIFFPLLVLLVGTWLWSWSLRRQVNQKATEIRRELNLRSRAEDALRESEDKYRNLLENMQDGVFIRDGGVIRYANAAFARMLGFASERELLKSHFFGLLAPAEAACEVPTGDVLVSSQYECGMAHRDGKTRVDVFIHEGPVQYEGRLSLVGTVKDMTARKQAEEALRESEQRYREFIDLLPQGVFELDVAGRLLLVNRAGLTLFGYSRKEFEAGINAFEVLAPEDAERGMDIFERTLRGENHGSREYTLMRKDGKRIPCLIYASPIVRSGVTVGLRGIIIDNRDQKRLEQEILKAQKLESLGILAGGIAHDFNNILTSILGNLSLARLYLDRGDNGADRIRDRVSDAETASRRAKDLTQQLLTFSKGGKPVKRRIVSAEVIREAAGFTSIGSGVRCEFDLAEDLWDVEADAGQLTQVLNNLVINASQAMGRGGLVRITADNIPESRSKSFSLGAGNHIRICVEDRGTGIPEEYLSRVFDPYFTTKQGGSGLGLATAYSIVHNHGGTITVDSSPGKGTTVSIFLPAEGRCSRRKVDVEIEPVCGQGKILVMDDEEGVRLVVSEMLDVLGYRCVTSADGNEAVRLYRESMSVGDPFSAVLMDLTVPGGMGGKEAVTHLLCADPGARVIASSGYSNDPVMSNHGAYGFKGVIGKPYRVKELAEVVRRILQTSERTEH